MFIRNLDFDNFNYSVPSFVKNGKIDVSISQIVKHYLDDTTEKYDKFDQSIEIVKFFKRLKWSRDYKFKSQYKPPYTESKRGISNIWGRTLSKAMLDRHKSVGLFDDFDVYYKNSKKRSKIFSSDKIYTKKLDKDISAPDLVGKDSNGEFVLVESKGRLTKYTKNDLDKFVNQSKNGAVFNKNDKRIRTNSWAIPVYTSYKDEPSIISMVDPPSNGQSLNNMDYIIERRHYSKVLSNLGLFEMSKSLIYDNNQLENKNIKLTIASSIIDNNDYIISDSFYFPFSLFKEPFIYCLNIKIFRKLKKYLINRDNDQILELIYLLNELDFEREQRCFDGTLISNNHHLKNFRIISV